MIFSNLEAIIGQLFLAILVARLVGLYMAHASRDKLYSYLLKLQKLPSQMDKGEEKKD